MVLQSELVPQRTAPLTTLDHAGSVRSELGSLSH